MTIYLPPDDDQVDAFSHEVCRRLAQEVDASYEDRAVVMGLSQFLKLVGRIQADQLNRRTVAQVDKSDGRR